MKNNCAIVFPGQGSQSLKMLSEYQDDLIVRNTFKEANEILGFDVWDLTQNGPEDKLNQTEYTQPILLTASIALWRLWQKNHNGQDQRIESPGILAGHSLGEYTALVCANALALPEAVYLVRERGRCMQNAVEHMECRMAAILGLSESVVQAVCQEAAEGEVVSPANYNAPGQIVIAGQKNAVERALKLAEIQGAKRSILLKVSVPSHCVLMKPAANEFKPILDKISLKSPSIPILHNVNVETCVDPKQIKELLIAQLHQPVRWVETIQKMGDLGVENIVECGPGNVLTSLNKRIAPNISCRKMMPGEAICP